MLFTSWRDGATVATLGSWFWFVATKLKPRNNWCVFALGGMPGESGQATDAQIQACADDSLQWFPHENENYTNISHQAQMHHLLLQPLHTHQLTASFYLSTRVLVTMRACVFFYVFSYQWVFWRWTRGQNEKCLQVFRLWVWMEASFPSCTTSVENSNNHQYHHSWLKHKMTYDLVQTYNTTYNKSHASS